MLTQGNTAVRRGGDRPSGKWPIGRPGTVRYCRMVGISATDCRGGRGWRVAQHPLRLATAFALPARISVGNGACKESGLEGFATGEACREATVHELLLRSGDRSGVRGHGIVRGLRASWTAQRRAARKFGNALFRELPNR